MPQDFITTNAFNAGELSPRMFGRSDLPAYASGAALLKNWLVLRPGGLERRPGTIYVDAFENPTLRGRLFPFRFSRVDSFALLFLEGKMRVYEIDGLVLHDTHRVTAGREVDHTLDEITVNDHGFPNNFAFVQLQTVGSGTLPTGLVAATDYQIALPRTYTTAQATGVDAGADTIDVGTDHELVDKMGPFRLSTTGTMPGNLATNTDYYVRNPTATKVQLSLTPSGGIVNITSVGTGTLTTQPSDSYTRNKFRLRAVATGAIVPFSSNGTGTFDVIPTPDSPYELVDLPWLEDELGEIQYAQDKDILYLAHRNHPLHQLIRRANAAWELKAVELLDGPYLNEGVHIPNEFIDGVTVQASATTGDNVTVTASAPIFRGTDIGRPIRIGKDSAPAEWGWGRITGVSGKIWTNSDIHTATLLSEDAGAETVTFTAAAFVDGEGPIRFSANAPSYGLSTATEYWLHLISGATYSVHLSQSDALADTSRVNILASALALTCTSAYLTLTAHGYSDGEGEVLLSSSGALPSPLSTTTPYFIGVVDANTMYFSETKGGPAISFPAPLSGSGAHQINGATQSATAVQVSVKSAFPGTGAETSWRLGAFSADSRVGWPQAVTLHEQRLVLAGAAGTPQTIYASNTGDPLNFAPDEDDPALSTTARVLTAASGYTFRLNSEDSNEIFWLRPARILMAAGLGGLHHLSGTTIAEAIDPTNVNAKRGSSVGAVNVVPIVFQSSVVFVDETGRVLQRAEFRPDLEAIETTDLMSLADHLLPRRSDAVVQLASSNSPLPIIWLLKSDGQLFSLTLDTEQRVAAWARHPIAGPGCEIESIVTLPDTQGGSLWMIAKRTVNGGTVRHIERMDYRFELDDDQQLYQGLDGGPLPYNGAEVPAGGTFSVPHLPNETLSVLADGGTHPDVTTDSNGDFVLTRAASKVIVGYAYDADLQLLPLERDPRTGVSLKGREIRAIQIDLQVLNALGLFAGADASKLLPIEFHRTDDLIGSPAPMFTGTVIAKMNRGYGRPYGMLIRAPYSLPATILATTTRVQYGDR